MEVTHVARRLVDVARYAFRREDCRLPHTVNCFLFIWWVYRQCGIELPASFVDQLYCGEEVSLAQARPGDLIFTAAHRWNHYDNDRAKNGVGHSGILTERNTVIHASWRARRVVEVSLEEFLSQRPLRGVYRVTPSAVYRTAS